MIKSTHDEVEPLEPYRGDIDDDLHPMEISDNTSIVGVEKSNSSTGRRYLVFFVIISLSALVTMFLVTRLGNEKKPIPHHANSSIAIPSETPKVGDDGSSLQNATGTKIGDSGSSVQNVIERPDLSILPKKIYSVVGLESSGTQFVTRIITDALNLPSYREGSFPCNNRAPICENGDIQVQHFSLPWGSECKGPTPVVDVVLPSQCTRVKTDQTEIEDCNFATKELWGFETKGKSLKYPERYNLDITSHKEWYDAHGVEQFIIIVVRDEDISFHARTLHCHDDRLKEIEEQAGTEIIIDAINKYILKKGEEKLTRESYKLWNAKTFQPSGGRRLSALPFGDNVVLVSYESLLKLRSTYLALLYDVLGIDSNYLPTFKNGNAKYIPNLKKKKHLPVTR